MQTKREIVARVQKHIQNGGVVLAEKTKSIQNGGKHMVSVGPYRNAVPDKNKRFAVLYIGRRPEAHHNSYHSASYQAAHEFVSFCGNEIAQDARFVK